MAALLSLLLACASLGIASPLGSRAVSSLNEAAFAEAQQRDEDATRAFSNVQIKVSVLDFGLLPTSELIFSRHPTADVSSLTNCRATSAQT